MKLKTYISFIFLFLLGGIFILSCSKGKCSQLPDETYYLSSTDKAQIPYSGTDTLKFLHNAIDTILFIGQGKQSYFNVQSGMQGDCAAPIQRREEYTFKYTSTMYNSSIFYTYGIPSNAESGTQISILFEEGEFYNELISIRAPWVFNSLQIANKVYTNIALFDPTVNTSDSLYYNLQSGILRMSLMHNTSKWEIIKP